MPEHIIYTLKWKNFSPNVKSRVSDVIKEQSICDVTLVSDDQKLFQAHRYVLNVLWKDFSRPQPYQKIC